MRHEIRLRANYLCSYIKDRKAVLAHINRDYGTKYTMADLDKAMSTFSVPRKRSISEKQSLPLTPPISTLNSRGLDPLAIALSKYKPAIDGQ